jgi:argonaute-like protein implicated in RNA metabolism and viral defense
MDCCLDLSPKMLDIQDIENKKVKLGMKILEEKQTLEEFKDFILSFDNGYDVNEFIYDKFSSYTIYGHASDNWRYSVMIKMIVNCFKYYLYNQKSNYNGYYINDKKIQQKIYLPQEEHINHVNDLINNFNTYKQILLN